MCSEIHDPSERKAVEEVLGKNHRGVKVERNTFGGGKHIHLILVRIRKGEAKVVGMV